MLLTLWCNWLSSIVISRPHLRALAKATATSSLSHQPVNGQAHSGHVAAYQDGTWAFLTPRKGWLAWVGDEAKLVVHDGTTWTVFAGGSGNATINPTPLVGVNATADTTNRLSVASPATLFNHDGAGHQLKINKAATANTASLLFQDAFSGRAEFGLTGDDNFHVKVSADGTTWKEAIVVDRSTGSVALPFTASREKLAAARTYFVSPTGSDANDGLSAATPYLTIAKAYAVVSGSLDFGGQAVTIQLANGTYAGGLAIQTAWVGGGTLVLQGNTATPSSVIVNPGVFGAYGVYVVAPLPGVLSITGIKFVCAATAIHHESAGLLRFGKVDFGTCGSYHIATAAPGAKIEASDAYAISGPALIHWLANGQGLISVAGRTITITGTPVFAAAFAYATRLSQIQGFANTFTGTATGVRYLVDGNSLIFTNSAGATAYPGSSAGSVSTGGQYL